MPTARRLLTVALVAGCLVVAFTAPARANWGPENNCGTYVSESVNEHCYGEKYRETKVLASIDFVDTTSIEVPGATEGNFVTNEEWISFENQGYTGWIEDGQIAGRGYTCCTEHPFYAEQKGTEKENPFSIYISPGSAELNRYNHYVMFDGEKNGRWKVYWESGEVAHYGGGWPVYLTEQAAGIEASATVKPYAWGRDQVAASNGGEWWPWTGAKEYRNHGICMEPNKESPAAGNIMWGTVGGIGGECY